MLGKAAMIGLILLSVSLNAVAQILLRLGARSGFAVEGGGTLYQRALDTVLRPGLLGGFACYGLSILVWIYVLSRTEVSYAYPFLGLGFVLVVFASAAFLSEPLSPSRLIGTCLVALGVFVIARG